MQYLDIQTSKIKTIEKKVKMLEKQALQVIGDLKNDPIPSKVNQDVLPLEISNNRLIYNKTPEIGAELATKDYVDALALDIEANGDLTIDGDLTITGGKITFGNQELIHNETDSQLTFQTANIFHDATSLSTDAKYALYAGPSHDAAVQFYQGAGVRYSIGIDYSDSHTLKFDTNAVVGGSTKMKLDTSGNLTTDGTITSSNGVSQGKYIYDIQRVGYYSTSASSSYLPINGYILETTSTAGNNEKIAFVAPYNGTLEKIMWRSEIAQDGTFRNLIWESQDGTEVPGVAIGRWDVAVDVADDTTVEFDYTATPTTGTNVLTKGRIYAISIDPASAPNDTNATVVFKWDITT